MVTPVLTVGVGRAVAVIVGVNLTVADGVREATNVAVVVNVRDAVGVVLGSRVGGGV